MMPSAAKPPRPPAEHQAQQPGRQYQMTPRPQLEDRDRPGCGRLEGARGFLPRRRRKNGERERERTNVFAMFFVLASDEASYGE
jgi:hypothetical protein